MTDRRMPTWGFLFLTALLPAAAEAAGPATFHLSFDDFAFLEHDFVARNGHKSIEDRGLTLEEGRFGRGLRMNLTPHIDLRDEMSGGELDEVVAVMFRTWRHREHWTVDNQPFLWGAGRFNTGSGAVAFWVKGELSEGELFNQSAMAWGRAEKHLLAITVGADGRLGAHLVDARYARHEIRSRHEWDPDRWNHVVLNWDKARGLELIVNGRSAASSRGRDAWWETALPGLFHLPMPHVVYDELHAFSRPLERDEIEALARTNTPPASTETVRRSRKDRDRLARASGLGPDADLPTLEPLDSGRVLTFTEIVPAFVGEENIPAFFCRDGRYELAWPHPQDVFTPIPGTPPTRPRGSTSTPGRASPSTTSPSRGISPRCRRRSRTCAAATRASSRARSSSTCPGTSASSSPPPCPARPTAPSTFPSSRATARLPASRATSTCPSPAGRGSTR